MAKESQSGPALHSLTRKSGRYELSGCLDHLSSGQSIASLGTKSIGKMTVDCRFLFKKSQWGVLEEFPAGIIYLDLTFGPPQGYRVKSARLTVTLDDDDKWLNHYKAQSGRTHQRSDCPVHITDWYGPRPLNGEEKNVEFKRTTKMTPDLHAFGVGAGGMGVDWEKTFNRSSRWSFSGQLLPRKGASTYNTLVWDLQENEFANQAFLKSVLHTAFAFKHDGQPFLMKVKIEGKLQRFKHKLRFGAFTNRNEGQTTTLIDFSEATLIKSQLDEPAKSLALTLWKENLDDGSEEIHTPHPPSPQPTSSEMNPSEHFPAGPQRSCFQERGTTNNTADPSSSEAPRVTQSLENQQSPATHSIAQPTVEDLSLLARTVACPPEQLQTPGLSTTSSLGSSKTEVEEEEQDQNPKLQDKSKLELASVNPGVDQEAMLKIIQVPAVLAILQLLATLMGILRASTGKTKRSSRGEL